MGAHTLRGLMVAAPGSGSGKTLITLGLLRALKDAGVAVRGAKSGPDYIDPRFHEAASGRLCYNLDAFAMPPHELAHIAHLDVYQDEILIVEGAMGLFDGAPPSGLGSSADLARALNLPVVLVVDCAHMAQSVGAVVGGFLRHDPNLRIKGVILNKVGSHRHEMMLRHALAPSGVTVLGALYRQDDLETPSRHLGLVQASEHPDLENHLARAGATMAKAIDLNALIAIASEVAPGPDAIDLPPPPGQRVALASDVAFAFAYPHLIRHWRDMGAEILPFSPLNDEAPDYADAIILPGGYPELHAGRLAANATFLKGLRDAAADTMIYGECGGYMVLGEGLIDAAGHRHEMAGLLRLETSFAARKLHLGYRRIMPMNGVTGWLKRPWRGHEFHYATTLHARGKALFVASEADGSKRTETGLRHGLVAGSFMHLISGTISGAR